MRKLTAADYLNMPWKNGGGTTTQLAIFPSDATLDDFDWRISTACVASDGPFSAFPGIDRSLAVMRGGGLTLTVDGAPVMLDNGADPFIFRGEQHIEAMLKDGPVDDFNVMTRRSRCMHFLHILDLSGTEHCALQADRMLIHVAHGNDLICTNAAAETIRCDAGEFVLLARHDGNDIELSSRSPVRLLLTRIIYKETRHA